MLVLSILCATALTALSGHVEMAASQETQVQVHIEVLDADSGGPIQGADVVWDGAYAGSTDADGGLWITTTYPPADHSYQVMIVGYEPKRGTITIGASSGGGFTVRLKRSEPSQMQVQVHMEVLDADSGGPIQGADVVWDGAYAGSTGSDGGLWITTTYPPADHSYQVMIVGYEPRRGSITIGASSGGGFTVKLKRTTPPPPQTTALHVYSLPESFVGRDPGTLTGSDLRASVFASYVLNGQSESTTESTPFSLEADVGSQVQFSVSSVPSGWEFTCVWDHYGYEQHDACVLTIEASSGTQRIAAFFSETAPTTVTMTGRYVDLTAPSSYVGIIQGTGVMENLDKAYQLLWELTDIRPYGGDKILITLDPEIPEGLSYAGNPIKVGKVYWSETGIPNVVYHEMAHDFMGIPEFDRIVFPQSAFVEGFGELGRQYVFHQVDRTQYEEDASRYLRELKEQYLDPGTPFDELKPGPSAGILQDLTNRYGFDMWKRFFRTIYTVDVGPKESRTVEQRCYLFVQYISQAAGEDLTRYFEALRFPLPQPMSTTTRTTGAFMTTGTPPIVTTTRTSAAATATGTSEVATTGPPAGVTTTRASEEGASARTTEESYLNLAAGWWAEYSIWILGGALLVVLGASVFVYRPRLEARRNRFCAHCGSPMRASARYCLKCGESIVRVGPISAQAGGSRRNVFCLRCGSSLRAGAHYCLGCGEEVRQDLDSL